MLERASLSFIPVLKAAGEECGCENFTYTEVHGEADIGHADAFLVALDAESKEGYTDTHQLSVYHVTRKVLTLLIQVFSDE